MNINFIPTDRFIIRKPFLDYNKKGIQQKQLENLIRTEYFQEAIYYASPDLYDELIKYLRGKLSLKERAKIIATLYKYAQRLLYRSTPFGMFAYCGIGTFSEENQLFDKSEDNIKLNYRYDFHFLNEYINFVFKNASFELLESLFLCSNQTLVEIMSYYHFEMRDADGKIVNARVSKTSVLEFILNYAKSCVKCTDLVTTCLNYFDIEKDNITNYIKTLILSGLLISNIHISTTGKDNFNKIYQSLSNYSIPLLNQMRDTLDILSKNKSFEIKKHALERLFVEAKSMGLKVKKNQIIQIDTCTNYLAKLDKKLKNDLCEWFRILMKLAIPTSNPLENFIRRYRDRYEISSTPLLYALNKYVGIGYNNNYPDNSNFIKKIHSGQSHKKKDNRLKLYQFTVFEQIIIDLITTKYNNQKPSNIDLSNYNFQDYPVPEKDDFCMSYTCKYNIIGHNDNCLLLNDIHFFGTSAGCLITRFADGIDEINEILDTIAESEEKSKEGCILAEISHLSKPHSGNVQIRPSFRKYEIPYLNYNNSSSNAILLSDLNIVVHNNKIKLISQEHGKEVIPCFTSAFNYKFNTTNIYQFLGDIQRQTSYKSFSITIDNLLSIIRHIPRINYKNIIICAETWLIENLWKRESLPTAIIKFREIHSSLNMPQFFTYNEGDNYYVADINSDLSIEILIYMTKDKKAIVLKEFLPLSPNMNHFDSIIEIIQPFIPNLNE